MRWYGVDALVISLILLISSTVSKALVPEGNGSVMRNSVVLSIYHAAGMSTFVYPVRDITREGSKLTPGARSVRSQHDQRIRMLTSQ